MSHDSDRSRPELLAELETAQQRIARLEEALAQSSQSQKQVAQSQERFRTIFEQPLIGVVVGGPDGSIRDCNQAFAQMLGYECEELRNLNIEQITHPEDLAGEKLLHAQVQSGDQDVLRLEKRYLAKDGRQVWVDLTTNVSRDEKGEPDFVIGMVIDITARKVAEERLQESEARYKNIFVRSSEGILLHDAQGNILDANQAALDMFGYSLEEITRLHPAKLVPPEEREEVGREFAAILRDEYSQGEHRCLRKDGSEFIVITKGKLVGENLILGVLQDVTIQRNQEQRLRLLTRAVEQVGQSIVVTDVHGDIEYVNPHFTVLTGYSQEEVLGQNPRILKSGEMPDAYYDELWKTITRGLTWKGEFCNRNKAGELFWDSSTISPIFDSMGEITHFMGVKRDITREKQAEAALRESEERYRSIVESLPQGAVFLFDHELRYSYARGQALAKHGLAPELIVGKTLMDVFPGETGEISATMCQKIFHGESVQYQAPFRDRIFSCIGGPLYNDHGEVSKGLVVALDVTEAVQAAEAMREAMLRQEEAVTAGQVGIWHWDLASNEVFFSQEWKRQIGYEDDELENSFEQWEQRVHPDDLAPTLEKVQATASGITPGFEAEFRFRHRDGSWRWILARANALQDDSGAPCRVLGSHVDITARKELEESLLAAKSTAEAASKAKSEFLANMSHELRTPLNGIMGMLQLIRTTSEPEELGHFLEMATRSCTRLSRLMGDILDLSRIEAGKMEVQCEPLDLEETMRAIQETFLPAADQAQVALECTIDDSVCSPLRGDAARLQQVLNNLVGNALKFTTKGKVQVTACQLPQLCSGERRVLFTVSDTGIGIHDEMLDKLFEPFSQAEGSFTRKYQGAGLGLSIVKRLVQLMGGVMSVESEPDIGSTFHISIPFRSGGHPGVTENELQDEAHEDLDGLKVLVVEDDMVNRLALALLLKKCGCSVSEAEDGSQALDILGQQDFDIVLMDIQMPVLDGMATARRIRQGEAGEDKRNIPIIAFTAYAMPSDRGTFLEAGMNDYLAKPVDMRDLLRVIKNVLAEVRA